MFSPQIYLHNYYVNALNVLNTLSKLYGSISVVEWYLLYIIRYIEYVKKNIYNRDNERKNNCNCI